MAEGGTALVVVDMNNPYEHEDAEILSGNVERVVGPVSELVAPGGRGAGDDGAQHARPRRGGARVRARGYRRGRWPLKKRTCWMPLGRLV
jgi:hypothetical protein